LITSASITLVRFTVYAGKYNCNFLRFGISMQAPHKSLAHSFLIQLSMTSERVQNLLTRLTKKYRIMGN
jgi:hypothetical protein